MAEGLGTYEGGVCSMICKSSYVELLSRILMSTISIDFLLVGHQTWLKRLFFQCYFHYA